MVDDKQRLTIPVRNVIGKVFFSLTILSFRGVEWGFLLIVRMANSQLLFENVFFFFLTVAFIMVD